MKAVKLQGQRRSMAFGLEERPPRSRTWWLALGKGGGGAGIRRNRCSAEEMVQFRSRIVSGNRDCSTFVPL